MGEHGKRDIRDILRHFQPQPQDASGPERNPGPTGPTGPKAGGTGKMQQYQRRPTGPTAISEFCIGEGQDEARLIDFEERAAIREYAGGLPRRDAECAALDDMARESGIEREAISRAWADHPDAKAALTFLLHGSSEMTLRRLAIAKGWPEPRAWQALARLRAAGLAVMDGDRVYLNQRQGEKSRWLERSTK